MRVLTAAILFFAVLCVSWVSAQSSELPFNRGIYFAGSGYVTAVDGVFDGQSAGLVGTETFYLPKLNAGFGAGGLLGYRATNWAYEAGLFVKANGGSLAGTHFDTHTAGFTFDVEWLPLVRTWLQPYLTAGLGISTLTVTDGSTDGTQVGDARYYLGGFRIGLGIEAWVTRPFFVRLQGLYRIDRVVSIEGVNMGRTNLTDSLNADGYELSLIIGYIIL